MRNVANLVDTPKGRKDGRPRRAMTLDQTMTVLEHAKHDALHPYIVAWDEEAQEWRPVTEVGFRHAKYAVYVWRSVREDGDAKTELSHPCWRFRRRSPAHSKSTTPQQAKQRLYVSDG